MLVSCQNELDENHTPIIDNNSKTEVSEASIEIFSKILSKAVNSDGDLRNFIKAEALKKMTMDYDVFYPVIKDKIVHSGLTFRDILLQFVDNEETLKKIEYELPLLTIFIPNLPSGFSPETWDSENEIPCTTTGRIMRDSIFYYEDGKNVFSTLGDLIPGFPVLVLKNNERIKRSQGLTKAATAVNYEYEFIDEVFNGINPPITTKADYLYDDAENQFILNAYREMGVNGYKWQRDNIYYGFTSTSDENTHGAIDRSVVEWMGWFYLEAEALNKIADQEGVDPLVKDKSVVNTGNTPAVQAGFWTDGQFEFKIDVLINNISGLGSSITKYFFCDPIQLFEMEYDFVSKVGERRTYKRTGVHKSLQGKYLNIDLVTWDLESNGFSWKFLISEIDDQQQETRRDSNTSEFAANFSGGFKIGINFGVSVKDTRTNEYTLVTYKNSDDLGTLELNFSDPVILGEHPSMPNYYSTFNLKNRYVELQVIPRKRY